jgi:acetoin utilization deacetylase AcuC-like enzyme
MLKVAYAPVYKYRLPKGHRFPMEKYELLPEQLIYEGSLKEANFFHPNRLSEADILKVHTPKYWKKLNQLTLSRKEERRIGFPVRKDLIERGRFIAQGTYECAKFAMQYGVSLNIAGGTHHAFPDRGEGFCVFNDIAIASKMLLDEGLVNQILVIDLDVHQGNGTAHIFKDESRVFTFSMHGEKNYPLQKEDSDLDIGLVDKMEGGTYLKILNDHLQWLIDKVKPELIFFQSGVDVLKEDKLGRLNLSVEDCKKRDELVLSHCKKNNIPVAASMGGGYAERISTIIEAHANTYRLAQDIFF